MGRCKDLYYLPYKRNRRVRFEAHVEALAKTHVQALAKAGVEISDEVHDEARDEASVEALADELAEMMKKPKEENQHMSVDN